MMDLTPTKTIAKFILHGIYSEIIALISMSIDPSWDIDGGELASVRRYPNERQSPISVQ